MKTKFAWSALVILLAACGSEQGGAGELPTPPEPPVPPGPPQLNISLSFEPAKPLARQEVKFRIEAEGVEPSSDWRCSLDLGVPGVPSRNVDCSSGEFSAVFPVPGYFKPELVVYPAGKPQAAAGVEVEVTDCNNPDWETTGEFDGRLNGWFVGAGGCLYDPSEYEPEDVPPIMPVYALYSDQLVWNVNGFTTKVWQAFIEGGTMADGMGAPVVGIFNPTGEAQQELSTAIEVDNSVSKEVADLALARLLKGETVTINGASQGGIHISQAASLIMAGLDEAGLSAEDKAATLARLRLQTTGGFGSDFPEGPRYIHYANRLDAIPQWVGMTSSGAQLKPGMILATYEGQGPQCFEYRNRYDDGVWLPPYFTGPRGNLPPIPIGLDGTKHDACLYNLHLMDYERVWNCAKPGEGVALSLDKDAPACLEPRVKN